MLLQELPGETIDPSKVLSQSFVSDPRLVFAIRHIEDPVAGVFDAPMTPYSPGESLHSHGETADVIAELDRLLPVTKALRRDDPDGRQSFPEREPWQVLGGLKLEIGSRLFASMALLGSHMLTSVFQVSVELFVDVVDDRLMQSLLVSLQPQDIVGFPIDDLLRDRLLGFHRVNGDDRPLDVYQLEKLWNCGDFVRFLSARY